MLFDSFDSIDNFVNSIRIGKSVYSIYVVDDFTFGEGIEREVVTIVFVETCLLDTVGGYLRFGKFAIRFFE